MMPFTNVDPDAIERRVIQKAILHIHDSADVEIDADEIISTSIVEEDAEDASTEIRIIVKGDKRSIVPYVVTLQESMRSVEKTPQFNDVWTSVFDSMEYDMMANQTTIITKASKSWLNQLIHDEAKRLGNTAFYETITPLLEEAFDESRGDYVDTSGHIRASMTTFFEAFTKMVGLYPVFSRAVDLTEQYLLYQNYLGSATYLAEEGYKQIGLDRYIMRRSYRHARWSLTRNGVVFYLDSGFIPAGTRTLTKDQYSAIQEINDAKYGKGYQIEMRGDSRLEIRDTVQIDGIDEIVVNRIETTYDGTEKSIITGTVPVDAPETEE